MKINFWRKPPTSEIPFSIGVPALIWQVLFFYLPLVFIVVSSILLVSESGAIQGITFDHLILFLSPTYAKVIGASLFLAFGNAVICLLIGYPIAYFLSFKGKRFKNLLLFLLIVPFWTNFLLHVYAWFFVLEREGFLNNLLKGIGVIQEPLHILNSVFAIMIMMVYYYLPFMVLPLYSSLEKFDYRLIEASYALGAGSLQTFRRILLPMTKRGVRAGFFLVFIPSFGEFAIPELMGGDKYMFVGSVVSQYILGEETGSLGAAFTVVSCIVLLLSAVFLYWLIERLLTPKASYAKAS
jgi:spermidine/putrescine transport system permease protein